MCDFAKKCQLKQFQRPVSFVVLISRLCDYGMNFIAF